jgi:hypothetical protein
VISHRLWRERFNSDPAVLGEKASYGESKRTYRVIGVLPQAADRPEFDLTSFPIWVPSVVPRSGEGRVYILARSRG